MESVHRREITPLRLLSIAAEPAVVLRVSSIGEEEVALDLCQVESPPQGGFAASALARLCLLAYRSALTDARLVEYRGPVNDSPPAGDSMLSGGTVEPGLPGSPRAQVRLPAGRGWDLREVSRLLFRTLAGLERPGLIDFDPKRR